MIEKLRKSSLGSLVSKIKRCIYTFLPDKMYMKIRYKERTGKKLNLKNPVSFNEKLQWLKVYNRNPQYTQLVDKYGVRQYVAEAVGEQYLKPLLGVWDKYSEIDFNKLPEQFVLKCTHDCGSVVICTDRESFDYSAAKTKITKKQKVNYFYKDREWPYKNVKPRIIAEKYIEDINVNDLWDYKIFCFDGIVKLIQVDYGFFTNHKRNFYTPDWEYLEISIEHPTDRDFVIQKPANLEEMKIIASSLAKDHPFIRVDLFTVEGNILFGELTFYPDAGIGRYNPESFNYELGSWLNLPEVIDYRGRKSKMEATVEW